MSSLPIVAGSYFPFSIFQSPFSDLSQKTQTADIEKKMSGPRKNSVITRAIMCNFSNSIDSVRDK